MKLTKILLSMICMLALFNSVRIMADSEVIIDLSGENTANVDITGILPGTENSNDEHTHFKLTNSDEIAYCSNGHHKNPIGEKDAVWNNCQTLTGANSISLSYIYENGYGSNKENYSASNYLIGKNRYTDYFITQAAVWRYTVGPGWLDRLIENNYTYNGSTNEATTKIKNLIEDALLAQEGPTLSITEDDDMSFVLAGNYYVSKAIKVSGKYLNSKISVTVSGPNGIFVTNHVNGPKAISAFDNNSTIYVKIPVKNIVGREKISFQLTVNATSAIGEGRIQECVYSGTNENEIQNIIVYSPKNEDLTASASYNVDAVKVNISKKDTNMKLLEGATLTIKQGNTEIYSWESEKETKTIVLLPGNYTLVETKSPNGYVVNNNIISFEVTKTGTVISENKEIEEILIINKPIEISVSKRTINKEQELPGATLIIKNQEGNIAKDIEGNSLEWTTTDKPKTIHIAAGKYILEEINAPSGYELSDKTIEFTVKEDGTVTVEDGFLVKKEITLENNLIIFENTPKPEDIPTGSAILYISIVVGMVSIGIATYLILKKSRKQ